MKDNILIINPGSTSTKYGIFSIEKNECIFEKEVEHDRNELEKFESVIHQKDFRKEIIINDLKNERFPFEDFIAVIGRGGLLNPIKGGVYKVNERMLDDLTKCKYGIHASNLGALMSNEIARAWGLEAYIADPVTVDEFEPYAFVTGFKGFTRKCRAHVLNLRQVARMASERIGKKLKDTAFIGVHLGGGITVAAMRAGLFIDVNNALLGDGPFSGERTGTLPVEDVIDIAYSGRYQKNELKKLFSKKGGLYSYLGISDFKQILERINNGDKEAEFYVEAFAYRIAKTIGEMSVVFKGKVDAIFITGGIARSEYLMNMLSDRVSFISRILIFPGQFEMFALGKNLALAFENKLEIEEY